MQTATGENNDTNMSSADVIKKLTAGMTPAQLAASKDENHDVEVYTVAIVFSALATLAVIMRVGSRHMKKVAFGVDDALVLIALVRSKLLAQDLLLTRDRIDHLAGSDHIHMHR